MQIKTKYDLEQVVWLVLPEYEDVPDPACGGTGKIAGKDGEEYECGNCGGHGTVEKTVYRVHRVTIDAVMTTTTKKSQYNKYGVEEQTIGVFEEDQLYPTEAEAQAECDRRNAGTEGG